MKTIKLATGTFLYDLANPLGKPGGFGQVFSGFTASGDEVAVKKLYVSAAEAAHRELQIADELKGRAFAHVIPVIDAGQDADSDDYFVVMPRADKSLQEHISQNASSLVLSENAASIMLEILIGLREVESIVHRDLKPDNILLHQGKWKVSDFGIARFVESITASNTLKQCLSPYYAAPEQWRMERSTHATDIYALGCIGFCLLTSRPPFIDNPEKQHQTAQTPDFPCPDSRLRTLLQMMLRKIPETRPSLERVESVLTNIIAISPIESASSLNSLASAAAKIATLEQKEQAAQVERKNIAARRRELAKNASEILSANIERLWKKIFALAPNVRRKATATCLLEVRLGDASFSVDIPFRNDDGVVFKQSGWDVLSRASIAVFDESKGYIWSATLLYAKPKVGDQFRWIEVAFWHWNPSSQNEPFGSENWDEIDLALSNVMHTVVVAFGPIEIDDEKESEFHDRWVWLFSKALVGELRRPSNMPIRWPPAI